MNSEKLSFAERDAVAIDIVRANAESKFITCANQAFGNKRNDIGRLYWEIRRDRPQDGRVDVMAQVLERLPDYSGWSRNAFNETLRLTNVAIAAKSMDKGLCSSLAFLPSAETIFYLSHALSLSDDIVLKLQNHEVNGRFLRDEYARGTLHKTLLLSPFSLPFGVCSHIESWVRDSLATTQLYERRSDVVHKEGSAMNNPFVESMAIQNQTKSMLASALLSQRADVALRKHVQRLMLALGDNDAWLKFAKAKGATSGAEAEKRISEAQATGEPETIVIPAIAQAPNYLALTFLAELKTMAGTKHVVDAVECIEQYLACVESAAQNKGNKVAEVNGSIRQWIVQFELCDTTSQSEIQARVDALKNYEVTSLEDLKILDTEDFEKCGFRGVKAKKAFIAAQGK